MQLQQMRWGSPANEPEPRGTTQLPCGNTGVADGCGWRCTACFTIYGSISCPCHSDDERS